MTSGRDDAVRVLPPQETPKFLSDWCAQGMSDGLGDRLLMYDDNAEPAWEVLRIHHDLATAPGFRDALLRRLDQLALFQHASFPKVRAVEDFAPGSAPLLASSHTPGRRLAEAFTSAGSVGLAMLLIRDLTGPLAALHSESEGVAHGALTAGRITVTNDGRLVIRDHVFGPALDGLRFSASQTWARLGVVVPEGSRSASTRVDVLQVALIALSSLAGRTIGASDYPDRLEDLLDEFALFPPLRNWLEPALQLNGQGFESAGEAEEAIARLFPDKLQGESQIRTALAAFAQSGAGPGAPGERPPSVRRFIGNVRMRPQMTGGAIESRRLIEERADEYAGEPARPLEMEPAPSVVSTPAVAEPAPVGIPQAVAPASNPVPVAVEPPAAPRAGVPHLATKKSPLLILQAEEDRQEAEGGGRAETPAMAAGRAPAPRPSAVAAFGREEPSTKETPAPPAPVQIETPAPGPAPSDEPVPAFGRMSRWERRVRPGPAEAPATAAPPADMARMVALPASLRWVVACVAILALGQALIISRLYFSPPVIVAPAVPAPVPSAPVRYDAPVETRAPSSQAQAAAPSPSPAAAPGENEASAPRPQPVNAGGLRLTSAVELFAFEGERLLGSSTDGPIVLSPGRHDLELVNSALGIRSLRTVTIRAGETVTMRFEAGSGSLNINATPWAEVLVDGKSVGETPIGNYTVPLGEHEVVFRHPQFGERREKVLVRAGGPTRVSVSLAR